MNHSKNANREFQTAHVPFLRPHFTQKLLFKTPSSQNRDKKCTNLRLKVYKKFTKLPQREMKKFTKLPQLEMKKCANLPPPISTYTSGNWVDIDFFLFCF